MTKTLLQRGLDLGPDPRSIITPGSGLDFRAGSGSAINGCESDHFWES